MFSYKARYVKNKEKYLKVGISCRQTISFNMLSNFMCKNSCKNQFKLHSIDILISLNFTIFANLAACACSNKNGELNLFCIGISGEQRTKLSSGLNFICTLCTSSHHKNDPLDCQTDPRINASYATGDCIQLE